MSDKKKQLRTIVSSLEDTYNRIMLVKKDLMNHPKMVEYLFSKPIHRCNCLADIMVDRDDSVAPVVLTSVSQTCISNNLFTIVELLRKYDLVYRRYRKLAKRAVAPVFPLVSKLSKLQSAAMDILDRISTKIKMDYTFQWTFELEKNQELRADEEPCIGFKQSPVYDFYGIVTENNRLVQFAIDFDDGLDQIESLKKQYYLFQMNIHFLRLTSDKQPNMKRIINKFISRIMNTTDYIGMDRIVPKIVDQTDDDDLIQFANDYQQNHIIFLKNNKKDDDDDDDDLFDPIIDRHYSHKAADQGYTIPNDLFERFTDKRFVFTRV